MNDTGIKNIGIIGAGRIGSQIARLAVAKNYDVVISNSRGPETLSALVAELGPRARAATAVNAAKAGDIRRSHGAAEELPGRSSRASGGQDRNRHQRLLPRT